MVGMAIKGNMRDPCGDENVLYLAYIHVNILVLWFCKMLPWGKLGKDCMRSHCIIPYNYM